MLIELSMYVMLFSFHGNFMKDEGDAIIVPICRQRGLERPTDLHPQAHGESVMEQGFRGLHTALSLPKALIWKEEGSPAFPWRAPHHTKDFCGLITLLVFGLHWIFDLGLT